MIESLFIMRNIKKCHQSTHQTAKLIVSNIERIILLHEIEFETILGRKRMHNMEFEFKI